MAVAFDAVGPSSAGASAAGATSLSWSHTNNGNAIIAGCAVGVGPDTGMSTTATYAAVAMAAGAIVHSNANTAGFLRVFTLASPATGANNVVVTLTGGTGDLTGGSISVLGAGSFVTQYSGTGAADPPTATSVGSTPGGLICAFVCAGLPIASATSPSTSRYIINLNGSSAAGNSGGATSPSTGSNVTTAWSITSDWWAVIGVEVLPASGSDELWRYRLQPPGLLAPNHAPLPGPQGDAAAAPAVAAPSAFPLPVISPLTGTF